MTRKEMKLALRAQTKEALKETFSKAKASGELYTLEELAKLSDGYLSPRELQAFVFNLSNQYSGCIVNGSTTSLRHFNSNAFEETDAKFVVDMPKLSRVLKSTTKQYVNIEDPNDTIQITRRKKAYRVESFDEVNKYGY